MHTRALAATVVFQALSEGRSLADTLPGAIERLGDASERALLQELSYGTLRWYPQLDGVAQLLLRKPFKRKDGDVFALLLVGLYQLMHLRVAPHAAVSLSVSAVDDLGKSWAKGLVNAVLRGYQRDPALLARACGKSSAALAHPDWLLALFKRDWPDHWQALAQANNARPPMTLRVNQQQVERDAYAAQLEQQALRARASDFALQALTLDTPVDVVNLPEFARGWVSVQDAAAQLAAALLDVQPGERVLDACAAPGGKSAHILERQPALGELVAVDRDAQRMRRVSENLQRLGIQATCMVADVAAAADWWDGRKFDRILLDAPCSATGVIRRHPDIKVLRRASDVAGLIEQQARLLNALWPLLQDGGTLVYATCSVLRGENELQVRDFLATHADAQEIPIVAACGHVCTFGCQILPGEADMDGFYYAILRKQQR
ncbi:MAG: 16S rRNA (cytosine(967)-C(5))-methyltransferase RsmB [Gammaproteobacteria bacterium]|nr:16S rRNA (cytosine(967)-C(5))-methyltransferase RsmB [Gammaproteobacteria bacterium]